MASSSSPSPPRTSTSSSDTNYPFPSEVNVANFVPIKLGLENYDVWKKLMLNLIESHRLVGFVDGTIKKPKEEQNEDAFWSWKRSDGLVRGWIFVTVTEELLLNLVSFETAGEVWDELQEKLADSDSDSDSDSESSDEADLKLNTDGCWYESTKKAGFGGIFRDKDGEWLLGYYGKLDCDNNLATEIWAIYKGLTIILEKNMQNVLIESDSQVAVDLITKGTDGIHPQRNIILEASTLLQRMGASLKHTCGEANECAYHLACKGAEQLENLIVAEEMPLSIREFLNRDRLEEIYPKRARKSHYLPLHNATLKDDWESATKFFEQNPNGVRVAITSDSETALMLAVQSSERNDFVKKLMEMMSLDDVARADSTGETALHKAVASGNNEAAKLLVEKNPTLPKIKDKDGDLAVHFAADRGNKEMVKYLLEVTKPDGDPNPFEGKLGVGLLNALAYGELYDIASTFLRDYPDIASMKPSPLIEMGYHLTSFRSGTRLNFFQRLIYSGIPRKLEGNANNPIGRDIENSAEGVISSFGYLRKMLPALFWDVAEKLVPPVKFVRETKLIHRQAFEFVKHLCEEVAKSDFSKAEKIFRAALKNAVSLGTGEIVEEIVLAFPSAIKNTNKKDQNIFHVAIENRHANVFNLIYRLDAENQKEFLAELDMSGNNALHTAGKLLSQQQLSLRASVAGAALQMQRELQWFKLLPLCLSLSGCLICLTSGMVLSPKDVRG